MCLFYSTLLQALVKTDWLKACVIFFRRYLKRWFMRPRIDKGISLVVSTELTRTSHAEMASCLV